MSDDAPDRAAAAVDDDRLDDWKEIAAFLGKSVRTVQRWEHELGLPIHRLPIVGRASVYARRNEIAAWRLSREASRGPLEEAEGPGPQGPSSLRRPRRALPPRALLALTAGVVAVAAAWLVVPRRPNGGIDGLARQPASWRARGDTVTVYDAGDAVLWTHRFDFGLDDEAYPPASSPVAGSRALAVADLDNDGGPETLFLAYSREPHLSWLYCFRGDGSVRFRHRQTRSIRFGAQTYPPPFGVSRFLVAGEPDGTTAVWLASQHLWFPTVVHKLSPDGEVRGEFWNNGHVSRLEPATVGGRQVVLVGGTNNALHGAALAVLDARHPNGSVPADAAEPCVGCPPGRPLAYFVFPAGDVARALHARPYVTDARLAPGDDIGVTVRHASTAVPGFSGMIHAHAHYRIDARFRVLAGELNDDFPIAHLQLELLGLLDHPFGSVDRHGVFPVRAWDGHGRVELAVATAGS